MFYLHNWNVKQYLQSYTVFEHRYTSNDKSSKGACKGDTKVHAEKKVKSFNRNEGSSNANDRKH